MVLHGVKTSISLNVVDMSLLLLSSTTILYGYEEHVLNMQEDPSEMVGRINGEAMFDALRMLIEVNGHYATNSNE